MRSTFASAVLLLLASTVSNVAGVEHVQHLHSARSDALQGARLEARQSSPTPPSKDSFYKPTGDWQSAAPGKILAHRTVPMPLKNVSYTEAYQLLYRTTDSLGNATATVTTVIIPMNPDFSKLLSYQQFEDSADPDCAPSYTMQEGGLFQLDTGFERALSLGWIVSTPDYEGPLGSFTAGVISGQATLDSIRAVLSSESITKVPSDATVAMYGYSGGALASEWATELQGSYAPELMIKGVAIGGLTPNVTNVALTINGQSDAGLLPAGLLGLVSAYPNITGLLNSSFVSPQKKEQFWSVKTECLAQDAVANGGVDFFSYFTIGKGILTFPETRYVANAGGQMGLHGTPLTRTQMLVYKSTKDEVSPVADTDKLINQYCKAGSTIHYIRDDYGSHTAEATNREQTAIDFLTGIFNGTQHMSGCLIETFAQNNSTISSTSITATTSVTPTPSSSSSMSGSSAMTTSSSMPSASSGAGGSGGSSGSGGSGGSGSSGSSGSPTSSAPLTVGTNAAVGKAASLVGAGIPLGLFAVLV